MSAAAAMKLSLGPGFRGFLLAPKPKIFGRKREHALLLAVGCCASAELALKAYFLSLTDVLYRVTR